MKQIHRRRLQRIIALVLIAAMLWQTDSMRFFSTAYAAELEGIVAEETDVTLQEEMLEEEEQVPLTVLGEVESLRTQDEKHFRMSDGSFMAVSFGMPVHYQDTEGQWQEIDNRMVLSEDQNSYGTSNLQSTTSFAASLDSGTLFETSYGDTFVSMSLLDTASANLMMNITEEPVATYETGTIVIPRQSTTILESDTVSVVGSEVQGQDVQEKEIQIQALNQGVLTEMADSDLLVFDRAAIADTTVEVLNVLGESGNLSDIGHTTDDNTTDDNTTDNGARDGWTMEDILPENIQDSLLYADAFPGVDLLYTKYSHNVKEQIIVNEPQSSYRYDFKLTLEGVEAVLNENGSVSLKDEETGEEIYYIPAPYMEDANGRHSYDAAYVLSTTIDGVVLSVIADSDWMNDAERAFPVAIDPTLIITGGTGDREIYASYTAEGAPNSTNSGETFIGYTTWESRKEYQAFAGFKELPPIPQGMTVVKADFYMTQSEYYPLNREELGIGVYEVTESMPSNVSYFDWIYGMTWNTKPDYDDSNMIDYAFVSEATVGELVKWDLTEVVKKWYIEGSTTRAIAMTMVPGEYDSTHYASASFYEYSSVNPPILAVYYRDMVGIESYYTYQTLGVGDAGTAYIADATGQIKVVNPLVTYASTVNPFALSLVYNSDYFQNSAGADYQPPTQMGSGNIAMKLGQGWTLDIIQTMKAETIEVDGIATEYLCYTDGDGTRHYFIEVDEKNEADDSDKIFYYDEDGLGLKAEITNRDTASFVMYDDNGNTWTFTNGRLTRVADETANAYVINWNSSNQITQIVQVNWTMGPIRVATFAYSGTYVSSITDAADNVYSFTYTGEKLTAISRNGTQIASYGYLGNGYILASIRDEESGYARGFSYTYGKLWSGGEHVNGLFGNSFSVSYPNYSKTVYRTSSPEGTLLTSYLFDYAGRTINAYVTDEENNLLGASNAVYIDVADSSETVNKKANRTEKIGSIGVSNPTLFHYGSCENAGWTFLANTAGVRTAAYSSEQYRTGVYSLKMVSQNTDEALYASASSLSLAADTTYTLSAYVRTKNCTSITGEGIRLKVTDASGNTFTGKGISYITTDEIDSGWTRIHVTFTAVSNGVHTLYVSAVGTMGTFYMDDVQLEEGNIPGALNLLKNGSMETNPCGWNGFNGAGYSSGTGWNNSQSMRITGDPVKEAYIRQDVSINLPATETFVLSGWAKGNSVPDNVTKHEDPLQDIDKQFGLRARILYADNSVEYHYVPFNPEVSEWQFASLTIVPKTTDKTKIITSIRVICTFEGNANEAYFDNICLSREVAQIMDYDDDGNLKSVSTTGLSADANTYEGGNLIETVTGGNGTYTYSYDETYKHRLTGVTDGVITQELTYDRNGNSLSTTLKRNNSSNPLSITTSATYSGDGNRLTGVTDATGSSISYAYGNATSIMYGLPTTTTDGRGNSTTATYDSEGRTTGVVVPEEVEVLYSYSQGLLTSIERNDLSKEDAQEYHFTYDAFGRTTAIYVGETLLASYVYRSNGDLVSMTYGNGTTLEYAYDILGRVIRETYSKNDVDGRIVEYFYGNQGQVTSVVDSVSGTTNYIYDSIGRLAYFEQEESGVRSRYIYDTNNRLIHTVYQLEDCYSGSERYAYNSNTTDSISDGIMVGMQLVTTMALSKTFDELQRLTKRTILGLSEEYTYTQGEEENTTTTQVSGKKNTLGDTVKNNFQYTYDGNGNILTVTDTVTGETITYSYDVQNQLIGAVYSTGRTESYSYDSTGNILSFNNGTSSHTYTYGNDEWKDQLTAVDGVALTYDAIGNPLTYHNGSTYTMSWTEGRKLATITVDGETTSYLYDADGIRIQKTYSDGSYIRYINAGGVILGEKHYNEEDELTKSIRYIFDDNGSVCGYMSSTDGTAWTMYHFVTNLQGDVLYVYQAIDRTIVASYSYDSWGNIISQTGDLADENPFRYRGYYYDEETGFYATSTRYYDPEIGRFINADDISMLGANGDFASLNLYAYCGNNPVIREDKGGKFWNIVAGAVIGAVISTTIQIVTNVATGKEWHEGALLAFAGGAITGGLAATGAPILVQAAVSGVVSASTDLVNQYTDDDFEQVDWVQVGVAGGAGFVSGLIGGNGIQHKNGSLSHAKGIYKYTVDNIKNRAWSASKANTYLNLASKNLQKVWTKELLITTGRYVGGAAVATAAQQGFSYLKEL